MSSLPQTHKAIFITGTSQNLDAIKYGDFATPQITTPNDVIIKNKYSGVNLVEAYFRKGAIPVPSFPYPLGREASGTVAAIGSDVKNFKVGDKVAYLSPATFAEYTKVDSTHVKISILENDVSEEDLKYYGSVLNQALTALTITEEAHKISSGEYVLIWASAGGVGSIVLQLALSRGAIPIAIASTNEKLEVAKVLGAKHLINSSTDDIVKKVLEITNGEGVNAVFDSVGKDSFESSYGALARKGTFVIYGGASGPNPPIEFGKLQPKNIKFLYAGVGLYLITPKEWNHYFDQFKELLILKRVKFDITKTYPLSEYAEATRALENRETTGKLTLAIGDQ